MFSPMLSPIFSRLRTRLALAAMAALFAGCATLPPAPPPLGYGEIVAMLQQNRPQPEIITEIRQRGVVAAPTTADVDAMTQAGGTQDLVDAVLIASWRPPAGVAADPYPAHPVPVYGGYSFWPWFGIGVWGSRPSGGYVYRPGTPGPVHTHPSSPSTPSGAKPFPSSGGSPFRPSFPKPVRRR
jgi:hypothetical protein